MAARVTRKRARTSSNVDASHSREDARPAFEGTQAQSERSTKRDEEFWYSDGSVILVARDVEFRVYKGILADHSPVFKDMFSIPQPPDPVAASPSGHATPRDACPVVHLSDSPEDLRHILRIYMPKSGSSEIFPITPKYSFDTVSAVIRLGDKYQMSDLVERALSFFKMHYPYNYTKWISLENYGPPWFEHEHSVGVVNLARLTGEPTLLLMALLSVACGTPDGPDPIICGFEREDGSRERLSEEDACLVLAAKGCLVQESVALGLWTIRPELSEGCKTRQECNRAFREAHRELAGDADVIVQRDPFTLEWDSLGLVEGEACKLCEAMVQDREDAGKKAVWEKLPEIFGLQLALTSANAGQQNADDAAAGQT